MPSHLVKPAQLSASRENSTRCLSPWIKYAFFFKGQVTDFHAWDRALDLEEMIDWTNCALDRVQGSIVRWDPDLFNVENMTRAEATLDEVSFQKA